MSDVSFWVAKTRDQIRDGVAADFRNTVPTMRAEKEGDDGYDIANAIAGSAYEGHGANARMADEAFPQTASFASLVKHAQRFIGMPHAATKASGLTENNGAFAISGTPGSSWTVGKVFVHQTTAQQYVTLTAGTLGASGIAYLPVEAVTAGDAGALADGETVYWESHPAGIAATATVDGDMTGGTDAEDRDDYLARYLDYIQNPQSGGTAKDFEQWAMEVEGVGYAAAAPNRTGLGTCDVAVLDPEGEAVSDAVLADVQDNLDLKRPCTSLSSTAVKPVAKDVDLVFEMDLASAYAFSDFTGTTVSGADSTKSEIHVVDASTVSVRDWIANLQAMEAREVLSIDTTGAPHKITVSRPFTEAPTAADNIIPGCPTYDVLADAIASMFPMLEQGGSIYSPDMGERELGNMTEVLRVTQTSPLVNVQAAVDATKIEYLSLASLELKKA